MTYFSEKKSITLEDGTVLQNKDGQFPPLQEITQVNHACDICPVRVFCQDNNEFDCQVYGMFEGFYFGLDDAFDLAKRMNYIDTTSQALEDFGKAKFDLFMALMETKPGKFIEWCCKQLERLLTLCGAENY